MSNEQFTHVFSVAELALALSCCVARTRNPEGCQSIAGGRSAAQTPGLVAKKSAPRRGARRADHVRKATNLLRVALKLVDPNFSGLASPRARGRRKWPCRPAASAAVRHSFFRKRRFLAPFQGAIPFIAFPGVCAALRPPAIYWQPSRLRRENRNATGCAR